MAPGSWSGVSVSSRWFPLGSRRPPFAHHRRSRTDDRDRETHRTWEAGEGQTFDDRLAEVQGPQVPVRVGARLALQQGLGFVRLVNRTRDGAVTSRRVCVRRPLSGRVPPQPSRGLRFRLRLKRRSRRTPSPVSIPPSLHPPVLLPLSGLPRPTETSFRPPQGNVVTGNP